MYKSTFFYPFVTVIALLVILHHIPSTDAQVDGPEKHLLQADSPVRLQLKKDRVGKIQFEKLMNLFEYFSRLSEDINLNECTERCFYYDTFRPILEFLNFTNPRVEPFYGEISRIFGEKGINLGKFDQSFVQDARQTIREGRAAISRAFKSSPKLKKLYREEPLWKKGPFEMKGWYSTRNGQTCTLDVVTAFRFKGSFYLASKAVSHPFEEHSRVPESQIIVEFIHRDLNSSILMTHPPYRNSNRNSINGTKIEGTTLIVGFFHDMWLSIGRYFRFDTHPALQEAYHKNRHNVDLALDAVTPSNIAVLALPMVMNLVPGAVLEDLKTWIIVLYIIFTDIFSCIPFIIKGIELITVSANEDKDYLAVDREGSVEKGFIEIYVASCSELKDFQYGGKVFIIVGVLMIIFGVGLELLALYLVKRRKMKKVTDVDGIFGLSFYLEKSELGMWRNDMNKDTEEMQLVEGMKRYSELSYSDEDPSVIWDNGWKAWWMK